MPELLLDAEPPPDDGLQLALEARLGLLQALAHAQLPLLLPAPWDSRNIVRVNSFYEEGASVSVVIVVIAFLALRGAPND